MTEAGEGNWSYLFVHQPTFKKAIKAGVASLEDLTRYIDDDFQAQTLLVLEGTAATADEQFETLLPLYSLEAAAGYFGSGSVVECEGWVYVDGRLDDRMFLARIVGRSMEPRLNDGDVAIFRARPAGSRQGKIVLVQYQGPGDPETGGSYTVKRYRSESVIEDGELIVTKVILEPLNLDFDPIVLTPEYESDVQVVAEFVEVLDRSE